MKNFFGTIIVLTILFFALGTKGLMASDPGQSDTTCGLQVATDNSDQVGGRFVPSITTNSFFRVLVIFAQFPDDGWNTGWTEWPKGGAPTYMHSFIDSTTSEMSNNGNITQYFRVMSMSKFTVIGKCYSVIAPHTRQWYDDNSKGRAYINQEVIQKLNQTVSFAPYDNWQYVAEYNNVNTSDGQIDMIWVIWRNIDKEKLGFKFDSYFAFSGEASLGSDSYNVEFSVDNGARTVAEGYPGYGVPGSGLTVAIGYDGYSIVEQNTIHEFGHYLLGGTDWHLHTGTWGIMAGYWTRGQGVNPANSYERNRLGWINIKEYDYNPTNPIPLGDYITTGDALRIAIPNTNPQQYYYLENHQRISSFDHIDQTSGGQGLYVLYQSGTTNYGLAFYNAEGKADWSIDHYTTFPGSNTTVPVFRKGPQDPTGGSFDSQSFTYTDPNTGLQKSTGIQAYTVNGTDYFNLLFRGNGKNEMKPGYVDVYSPWSNPPLNNVSFQVVSNNGQLEIKQYVESGTLTDVPPAKPQNLTVGLNPGDSHVKLQWDANTEPDLNSYVISRKVNRGGWDVVATTTNTYWVDPNWAYDNSTFDVSYKIRAKDNQNKYSVYSDPVTCHPYPMGKKNSNYASSEIPDKYRVSNYPNPFNPTTTIAYDLPVASEVDITIYDMLGNEIKTFHFSSEAAGRQEVTWNSTNDDNQHVASGVYLYDFKATALNGESKIFEKTAKLILMK